MVFLHLALDFLSAFVKVAVVLDAVVVILLLSLLLLPHTKDITLGEKKSYSHSGNQTQKIKLRLKLDEV